jgi:hypothetical protein
VVQAIHTQLFAELELSGMVHLRNPVFLGELPMLLASYLPAHQFLAWLAKNKTATINPWHYSLVCFLDILLPCVGS